MADTCRNGMECQVKKTSPNFSTGTTTSASSVLFLLREVVNYSQLVRRFACCSDCSVDTFTRDCMICAPKGGPDWSSVE